MRKNNSITKRKNYLYYLNHIINMRKLIHFLNIDVRNENIAKDEQNSELRCPKKIKRGELGGCCDIKYLVS